MFFHFVLPEIPDRLLHGMIFGFGLFFATIVKTGFERLANRFWNKAGEEAQLLAEFQAWKKTRQSPQVS